MYAVDMYNGLNNDLHSPALRFRHNSRKLAKDAAQSREQSKWSEDGGRGIALQELHGEWAFTSCELRDSDQTLSLCHDRH